MNAAKKAPERGHGFRAFLGGFLLGGTCGSYTTRMVLIVGERYFIEPAVLLFVALATLLFGFGGPKRLLVDALSAKGLFLAVLLLAPLAGSAANGVPLLAALPDLRALALFAICFYFASTSSFRFHSAVWFLAGMVVANMAGTIVVLGQQAEETDIVSFDKLRVPVVAFGILVSFLAFRLRFFLALLVFGAGLALAVLSNYRNAIVTVVLVSLVGSVAGGIQAVRRGAMSPILCVLLGMVVAGLVALSQRDRISELILDQEVRYSQLVRKTDQLLGGQVNEEGSMVERWRDLVAIWRSFPEWLLPSGYGSRYYWTFDNNPTGMRGNTMDSVLTYGLVHFGALLSLVWLILAAGCLAKLKTIKRGLYWGAGIAGAVMLYSLTTAESLLIPEIAVVNGVAIGMALNPRVIAGLFDDSDRRRGAATPVTRDPAAVAVRLPPPPVATAVKN